MKTKKRKLCYILLFILLITLSFPAFAADSESKGTIKITTENNPNRYTTYQIFEYTSDNVIEYKRIRCRYTAACLKNWFVGPDAEKWVQQHQNNYSFKGYYICHGCDNHFYTAEDFNNHCITAMYLNGIGNPCVNISEAYIYSQNPNHATASYDEETVKIELDDNPNGSYYIFKDSEWYPRVKNYYDQYKDTCGFILKSYNDGDFYVIEYDSKVTNSQKEEFYQYLYGYIPIEAAKTSKERTSSTVNFKNLEYGMYLVIGEYDDKMPIKDYIGTVWLNTENAVTLNDKSDTPEPTQPPTSSATPTPTPTPEQKGTIVVKYQTEDGILLDSVSMSGVVGTSYTTQIKSFTGYRLKTNPDNAYGRYLESNITVTYVYEIDNTQQKNLQVKVQHYLDGVLKEGETISKWVQVLQPNTVSTSDISENEYKGYKLSYITVNGAKCSQLPGIVNNQDIIAYYYVPDETQTKVLSATVKYSLNGMVQENDTIILTREVPYLSLDNIIETNGVSSKDYFGYELANVTVSGKTQINKQIPTTVKDGDEIVFYYEPILYTVTINYWGNTDYTSTLASTEKHQLILGSEYSYPPKEFVGFQLVETLGAPSEGIIESDITINYVYKAAIAQVIVNYYDLDGNIIKEPYIMNGESNNLYMVEDNPQIDGYELVRTEGELIGRFDINNPIVISRYYKATSSSIVIQYIDQNENIIETEHLSAKNGESYNIQPKEIEGYTFVSSDNAQGIASNGIIVKLYYRANQSSILIKYQDEDGNEISPSVTVNGLYGENYTAVPKTIKGYELKSNSGNTVGTYGISQQEIIYTYQKLDVKLTIHYIDEFGEEIEVPKEENKEYGDEYSTLPKEIYGYEIKVVPDNADGIIEEDLEIVYVYQRKDVTLIVKYIDESGKILWETENVQLKYNDEYKTNAKDIVGYKLKEAPTNAQGIMGTEDKTITYLYCADYNQTKEVRVSIKHNVDGEIRDEEILVDNVYVLSDSIISTENLSAKEYDGYELDYITLNDNVISEVPIELRDDDTITYFYKKIEIKIIVNYVDENSEPIAKSIESSGNIGDTYKTEAIEVDGYTLVEIPSNAEGTIGNETIIVIYRYSKNQPVEKDARVIVKYVDENGKEISETDTIKGQVGKFYETQAKDIYGYKLAADSGNTFGNMTEEEVVVTYRYELVETSVEVQYITKDGEVLDTVTLNSKYGYQYSAEDKSFIGYDLISKTDNFEGVFDIENDKVIYTYRPVETTITIHYVDEDGNRIFDDDYLNGKYGDEYETIPLEVYGYEIASIPFNQNGNFIENDFEVVYIYKPVEYTITVKHIDTDNNEISGDEFFAVLYNRTYKLDAKSIDGYDLVSDAEIEGIMDGNITITCVYQKKTSKVTVFYVDEQGNELCISESIDCYFFDKYETKALNFEGYVLREIPENAEGIVNQENIEVHYIYSEVTTPIEKDEATLIVQYLDTDGNVIYPQSEEILSIGDMYETEVMFIDGYEIFSIPDNVSGTLNTAETVITYIYKKLELEDTRVVIYYADEDGKELHNSSVIEGKVGDSYRTSSISIKGYELASTKGLTFGLMTKDDIIVTYVYKKVIQEDKPIVDGKTLTISCNENVASIQLYNYSSNPIIYSGKSYDAYSLIAIVSVKDKEASIAGLPYGTYRVKEYKTTDGSLSKNKNFYTVEFADTLDGEESSDTFVKVYYVDENGNEIGKSLIINGKVGDAYKTAAIEIENYELQEVNGMVSGEMTKDVIEVTYIYKRIEVTDTPNPTQKPEETEKPGDKEENGTLTISNLPIDLVSIQLYNYNPYTITYNGKEYKTGALIRIVNVDKGKATIDNLPNGNYRIKYYKTLNGYSGDKNYYTVEYITQ